MKKAIIVLLCIISNMYYAQHNNPLKDEMVKSLQNDDLNLFTNLVLNHSFGKMKELCKHGGYTKNRTLIMQCDFGLSIQDFEELFRIGINKGREIIKNPNFDIKKKYVTLEQMMKILSFAYSLSYIESKYNIEYTKEQNKDLVNSICSSMIDLAASDELKDKWKDDEVKDAFEKCHDEIVKPTLSVFSSSPKWKEAKKGTYYIFK